MLRHRSDTRRQTARQTNKDIFNRCRALVLGGKHCRMISVETKFRAVVLLFAKPKKAGHGRVTVGAMFPFAASAPLKLRCFRRRGQRLARAQQGFDIDTIIGAFFLYRH